MSWMHRDNHDHDDARGGHGRGARIVANVLRVLGRAFGDADNPLGWSLPLYRLWGIAVRIHLLFLALILIRVLVSVFGDFSLAHTLIAMAAAFVLVLLHEYGHCFACRYVQGEADQILMWPLGGLATCLPPNTWRAHLVTAVGGPAVNAALLPVLGGLLFAFTGRWDTVLFNPFDLGAPLALLTSWTQIAVFWLYAVNAMLLAFNVLLPMYPLDGGRILQCLLWARIGRDRSLFIAANTGLIIAVLLGLFAVSQPDSGLLLAIALFGGIICWGERQKLKLASLGGTELIAFGSDDPGEAWKRSLKDDTASGDQRPEPSRAERRAQRAAERAIMDAKEVQDRVDEILKKISASGIDSLTQAERRILDDASKRSSAL